MRAVVREQLPPEWCRPVGDLDREAQRAVTLERARSSPAWDLPRRGFEKAYGGEDDIGGSMTLYEMLGLVDLSLMVKAGVQWGLFGGALQALGTRKHHERYLAADDDSRAAGLLRDDGVRSRLGRAVAAHHGDVRRRATGVRHPHAGRRRAQGLHRQRRAGRPDRRGLRPARHPGREPRGARRAGADPGRAGRAVPRRPDRGLRSQGRAQRGRQRAALVRRRTRAAGRVARPVRTGRRRRQLLQPGREPLAAVLHDARRAGAGPGLVGGAAAARRRRPWRSRWSTARTARSSPARAATARSPCWTTWPTSGGCCLPSRRRTRCTSPRAS